MNLLFLDSIERETYGGMEEWIRLVAVGLNERGHRSLVVGRKNSIFLKRTGASGIDTASISIFGDFSPHAIRSLKNLIEANDIDCLVANFNRDVRLGGLAAKWAGSVPVVWSVGLDIAGDKWLHRTLTPRLITTIIVPSQSLRNQLRKHAYLEAEDIDVISIGIEDIPSAIKSVDAAASVRARFGLQEGSILAATVGRFVEQKGHTHLIAALPELAMRHPELRLLFLGNGPLEDSLRKQATELGVSERVVFAGMQDNVAPILAGCDLMIHPSIEEPFGIAILEGMRAGLPVVASRVGGIPEVLGDSRAGIMVEPRNPGAIVEGVDIALAGLNGNGTFGHENRSRFESLFTIEKMIGRVEQKLESVCRAAVARGQA